MEDEFRVRSVSGEDEVVEELDEAEEVEPKW